MAKSLEDVLLNITHVKNKKCDGTLYLLTERLAWMPSGKEAFTISYNYSDIKVQKISADKKEKIQLQIVLHSSGASTFHFNNPAGRHAQLKDRESVKDLLQQMLLKFKKKINNDLEEKNKMLQEDPELFQLYKSLVASNMLTAEEFWANRLNKSKLADTSNQEIGVSAGFLADIQGKSEGCNGIRYNLTVDIIDNIFKTYPAVEQKHLEYVPDKMSEQEFWYEFFQSHYFHRDRTNISDKELFSDCAKNDEQILKAEIEKQKNSRALSLQSLLEPTSEEEYSSLIENKEQGSHPANVSLIRRFNQHSTMVLKSIDQSSSSSSTAAVDVVDGVGDGKKAKRDINDVNGDCWHGANKRQNQSSTSSLPLPPPSSSPPLQLSELELFSDDYNSDYTNKSSAPKLKLTKVDVYMHGPVPEMALTYNTSDELFAAAHAFRNDVLSWKCASTQQILSNSAGLNVLGELAPTGSLMQDSNLQQINDIVPCELKQDLKSMYLAMSELLRHFWACFPITTKELEDKAVRMDECLKKFKQNKLIPMTEKLQIYHSNIDFTAHMYTLLEKAFNKFTTWQSKKTSTKRT